MIASPVCRDFLIVDGRAPPRGQKLYDGRFFSPFTSGNWGGANTWRNVWRFLEAHPDMDRLTLSDMWDVLGRHGLVMA